MDKNLKEIIIYTDGGSINNPGKAAIGVIIKFNEKIKEYIKEIGVKTNNQAEYEAIIFAIEKIKQIFGKDNLKKTNIIINTDSQIVAYQLNNKFKVNDKNIYNYFIKAHNLMIDFPYLKINLIKRENNPADKLVKKIFSTNFKQ